MHIFAINKSRRQIRYFSVGIFLSQCLFLFLFFFLLLLVSDNGPNAIHGTDILKREIFSLSFGTICY